MKDPECIEFVASSSFKKQFDAILQHDRTIFEEPIGWRSKSISESPLMIDFSTIWKQLTEKYHTELSALAYRPIPDEENVARTFKKLIIRING